MSVETHKTVGGARIGYRRDLLPLASPAWLSYLVIILALFALFDAFAFGLTDLDEGCYSSIARQMAATGDYLTPQLYGEPWFQKPPLLYWSMAASMKVFGPSEFGVRLPSAVAFWAVLAMLVVWGNRRFGNPVGTRAAVIFGLSPLAMLLARLGITDMLLACCLMAALIAMWETARRPAWCILWGLATGAAVLGKGPAGLGLICLQALIAVPLLLRQGLRLRWALVALVIALLVPLPWYLGVLAQHGRGFFGEFIVKQNLLRFLGGDAAHAIRQPVLYALYYVLILWIGLFPFSVFAPRALVRSADPLHAYLQRWCWLVLAVFTVAVTKLPAYIFPMFPPIALLVAVSWDGEGRDVLPVWARRAVTVGGAALWAGAAVALAAASRGPLPVLLGAGLVLGSVPLMRSRPFGPSGGEASGENEAAPGRLQRWRTAALYPASALLLLVGLHFGLRAYDTVMLAPLRQAVRSVPQGRLLIIYRLPRGHPSVSFYRAGRVLATDEETAARRWLSRGAFCLTTERALPAGDWRTVRRIKSLGQTLVLVDGSRQGP